jgi:transposase
MTTEAITVVGGVDTHKHTHYAAALDQHGRLLGHQEIPATDPGYQTLLAWMRGHGQIRAIGVESTGSFGATLTRALTKAGERVVEVNRPNRLARRMDGKSDRLDAEQIARAVLGQTSTAIPKAKSGCRGTTSCVGRGTTSRVGLGRVIMSWVYLRRRG